MRLALALLFLLVSVSACAMGSRRPSIERKDQDKLWRPCQDFEVQDGSPVGKVCNRTCVNRKRSGCKQWKQNVRNFADPVEFEFFRAGSFVLIDEDNL